MLDTLLGVAVGLILGCVYHTLMRGIMEKNMVLSAHAGSAVFLQRGFFYLIPASAYIERGLYHTAALPAPDACPHGFTGNWSDDCPDCRH
jgi:hypothetical protein